MESWRGSLIILKVTKISENYEVGRLWKKDERPWTKDLTAFKLQSYISSIELSSQSISSPSPDLCPQATCYFIVKLTLDWIFIWSDLIELHDISSDVNKDIWDALKIFIIKNLKF